MSGASAKRAAPAQSAAATVNLAESPLAWLRRRKDRDGEPMISQAEFDAGERLRADFWFAQMTPRVTMNWSTVAPMQRRRRAGMALPLRQRHRRHGCGARKRACAAP